ncbi:MAG TPA: ribonuclease III [Candidatus Paceibacterota bacterium]
MDTSELENKIGVNFKDKSLIEQAVTHRSYLNENKDYKLPHNERLEFLGDAVLELVVTENLFEQFPARQEGELTAIRAALVNTGSLAESAHDIGLNDFLLLSKGEAKDMGRARQYILANTFEAVIGAIYLDQGYGEARDFITRTILTKTPKIVKENLWQDAKSLFQEKAQERSGVTPTYKTIREIGPDHAKKFEVGVYLGKELVAKGDGFSKQEAEAEAARKALEGKNWN